MVHVSALLPTSVYDLVSPYQSRNMSFRELKPMLASNSAPKERRRKREGNMGSGTRQT